MGREDAATQAIAQIAGVRGDIERDSAHLGEGRRLVVEYERFCEDPRGTLERIRGFLAGHGAELAVRAEVPERFESRASRPLDEPQEAALATAVERFFGAPEAAPTS